MAEDKDINEAQGLFAPMPPGSDFDMGKGLDTGGFDTGGFDPSDFPPILDGPLDVPVPGPIDLPNIDFPPSLPDGFELPVPDPIGIPPFPGGWHPGGEPEPKTLGDVIKDIDAKGDGDSIWGDLADHGTIPNVTPEGGFDGIGDALKEGLGDGPLSGIGDALKEGLGGAAAAAGHAIGEPLGSAAGIVDGAAGIVDGDQVGHTLGGSAAAAAAAAGAAAGRVFGGGGAGGGGPVQQGMNRGQAESVVEALRADQATLQSLIDSATRAVTSLNEVWKGADSQRFATEFASSRKQMDQAVDMIETMIRTLTQQISAQEGTSGS